MRPQGGVRTGTSIGGGTSSIGFSVHAIVFGSWCAKRMAVKLSAGFRPRVERTAYGATVSTRVFHFCHSARSFSSVMSMPTCALRSVCADADSVKSTSLAPRPTTSFPSMRPV